MKIGYIHLNIYRNREALLAPLPTSTALFDPVEGARTLQEGYDFVRHADSLGFDFISVSEHHRSPIMLTPNPALALANLVPIVKNASFAWFGPLMSINNPIRVAEEFVMLDQLTGGRLMVCPLRGTPHEHAVYNNCSLEAMSAKTEEAILLFKRILTATEPFAHKGEFFDFPDVAIFPGPTQRPLGRIFMAAKSDHSVEFAAKHGFRIAVSFAEAAELARLVALYREECAKAGWTPTSDDILYRAFCIIGEDDAQAAQLAARFAPMYQAGAAANAGGKDQMKGTTAPPKGGGLPFQVFMGGPQRVLDILQSFHEQTGLGYMDLGFAAGGHTPQETLQAMRIFGEQVLPTVHQFGGAKAAPV